MTPDKIFVNIPGDYWHPGTDKKVDTDTEYIRKDTLLEWVRLAYGKLSMNPFDVQDVFEELIDKIK